MEFQIIEPEKKQTNERTKENRVGGIESSMYHYMKVMFAIICWNSHILWFNPEKQLGNHIASGRKE